ncbi:hypothetical protein FS837_010913 [Tulasnella sp. UAMH 9824]|nr:hypothetical protein FS837_010913 [Tulasnella sp. UAMH 9824]
MSASKNDIFTSSWRASPPPSLLPPAPSIHVGPSGLSRSKTTGSIWRGRIRTAFGEPADLFPALQDMTPRAGPLPLLVIPSPEDQPSTDSHQPPDADRDSPSGDVQQGRLTSSFFDVSAKHKKVAPPLVLSSGYDESRRPVSPALSTSTSTLSHASTYSSNSNPSLSATLPFSTGAGPMSVANDPALLESVELRFSPTDEFCLGVGRYSRVYLASYRRGKGKSERRSGGRPPASLHDHGEAGSSGIPDEEGDTWKLCAVKKLEEDEESQRLGLREAWFLRQLGSVGSTSGKEGPSSDHPGRMRVVRLLGIKRGTDESSAIAGQGHKMRLSWPHPDLLHQALDGHKSLLRHSRHASLEDEFPYLRGAASSASLRPFASTPPPEQHLVLILPFAPAVLSDIVHSKPHLLTRKQHTKLALQLTQAVSYVHSQHILHTDIKPHNVLITSSFDVMLSDFNTAIHIPSVSLSGPPNDPAGLGTPAYSPPEFNRPPPSPFSYPSDVWALGVTLMVMIVGREPYVRLTSGKGRKGNGRQEMKMWLGKGAYWQWEAQERLEAEEEAPLSGIGIEFPSIERGMAELIGQEQLKKLLDDPEPSVKLLEVEAHDSEDEAEGQDEEPRSYDDGSSPLRYLGSRRGQRGGWVSQRIYSLLRSMCAPSPASRPVIDNAISVLEEEWKELERSAGL